MVELSSADAFSKRCRHMYECSMVYSSMYCVCRQVDVWGWEGFVYDELFGGEEAPRIERQAARFMIEAACGSENVGKEVCAKVICVSVPRPVVCGCAYPVQPASYPPP